VVGAEIVFGVAEDTDARVEYECFAVGDAHIMCFREDLVRGVNEGRSMRVVHEKIIAKHNVVARRLEPCFIKRLNGDCLALHLFFYVYVTQKHVFKILNPLSLIFNGRLREILIKDRGLKIKDSHFVIL